MKENLKSLQIEAKETKEKYDNQDKKFMKLRENINWIKSHSKSVSKNKINQNLSSAKSTSKMKLPFIPIKKDLYPKSKNNYQDIIDLQVELFF